MSTGDKLVHRTKLDWEGLLPRARVQLAPLAGKARGLGIACTVGFAASFLSEQYGTHRPETGIAAGGRNTLARRSCITWPECAWLVIKAMTTNYVGARK